MPPKKDNLVPLPLDPTGQTSPLSGVVNRLPDAGSADPLDEGASPTEQWLSAHPDGFDENAPVEAVTPPIPLDVDDETGDEAVATEPTESEEADASTVTPPVVATETTDTPPVVTDEKKDAAPVDATPKPASEAPKTYEPDERIPLAEGVEWTRQQVVDALTERVALQPKAAAADTFQKIFRCDAQQAEQMWAPVVERIVSDPTVGKFLSGYFDDPDKKAYLDKCLEYYEAEMPAQPQAAPQAQVSPEITRQLQELQTWKQERERQENAARFEREVDIVRARYPFVIADPALFNELRETAKSLWTQDHNKGLLDALAMKSALYDALAIARAQSDAPPQQAPAPQQSVPVLPSNGASPGATRRQPTRKRAFADTDEATQAWLADHPGDFNAE